MYEIQNLCKRTFVTFNRNPMLLKSNYLFGLGIFLLHMLELAHSAASTQGQDIVGSNPARD
jgi:hypothetical protein